MIKNPINDKLDIIILAGQSNAESSGVGPCEKYYQPCPEILMMKGDFKAEVTKAVYGNDYLSISFSDEYYIEQAQERLDGDVVRAVLALPFAENYLKNDLEKDRKILIVHCAVGGTGFAKGHWGLNDGLYNRLLKMSKQALEMNKENRVVAVVWHQGEHDSFEPPEMEKQLRQDTYKKNFTALVKGVREVIGEKVPFITAGFTKYWVADYPEQCDAVLTAIKEVCAELNDMAYIETLDLQTNSEAVGSEDKVHFSRQGIYILAQRYYNEYKKIVGEKE